MTTREALIADAERRDDPKAVAHLSAMSDEQVDAVLASLADWARQVEQIAQQMVASAEKAFAPLVALAEKYRDTP